MQSPAEPYGCKMRNRTICSSITLVCLAGTLLMLPAGLTGCSGSRSQVNDVQQLSLRLQGSWLLRSYRPSVSLESPLLALLNFQIDKLRVTINGSQLTAQGPGLEVTRSILIQEVVDQTATLVVTEPTGVGIRVWVEIRDNVLTFRPLDAPWNGEGTLQRL